MVKAWEPAWKVSRWTPAVARPVPPEIGSTVHPVTTEPAPAAAATTQGGTASIIKASYRTVLMEAQSADPELNPPAP